MGHKSDVNLFWLPIWQRFTRGHGYHYTLLPLNSYVDKTCWERKALKYTVLDSRHRFTHSGKGRGLEGRREPTDILALQRQVLDLLKIPGSLIPVTPRLWNKTHFANNASKVCKYVCNTLLLNSCMYASEMVKVEQCIICVSLCMTLNLQTGSIKVGLLQ